MGGRILAASVKKHRKVTVKYPHSYMLRDAHKPHKNEFALPGHKGISWPGTGDDNSKVLFIIGEQT